MSTLLEITLKPLCVCLSILFHFFNGDISYRELNPYTCLDDFFPSRQQLDLPSDVHDVHSAYANVLTNTPANQSSEAKWCIDTGASIHVCCDRSLFDDDFTTTMPHIKVAGVSKETMTTKGQGTIRIPVLDSRSNCLYNIVLDNVYYLPDQPHNLLSVKRLLDRYKSAKSPDFRHYEWQIGEHFFEFQYSNNMYNFVPYDADDYSCNTKDEAHALTARVVNTDKYVCSSMSLDAPTLSNYQMLYSRNNKFDVNLFGDDNDEKNFTEVYTDNDRYDKSWGGKSIFGIVPPTMTTINKVMEKAHNDFLTAPTNSTQFLVVPYLPKSSYWFYAKYYEILRVIPRSSSDKFTVHKDDYHLFAHLSDERPVSVVNGKPDHVYLPSLPFEFAILYRDSHTPMQTDDYVKLHLRFGHRSSPYITR